MSESEGVAQCTCVKGYYRVLTGEEDLPCNSKFTDTEENSMRGIDWTCMYSAFLDHLLHDDLRDEYLCMHAYIYTPYISLQNIKWLFQPNFWLPHYFHTLCSA